MTEHRSPIPARVYNAAVGGHVCGPEDVDFGQKVVHLIKYDRAGNEVSFESQVTQANKIYVIHDDFVLSSNVTIPTNCVLEFDGGSISGAHTLTGNNTKIEAGIVKIFGTDVIIAGTWAITKAFPEWFGGYSDSSIDITTCVIKAITLCKNVHFSSGIYLINSTITLGNYNHQITISNKSVLKKEQNGDMPMFHITGSNNIIKGGEYRGQIVSSVPTPNGIIALGDIGEGSSTLINFCKIDGLNISSTPSSDSSQSIDINCVAHIVGNAGKYHNSFTNLVIRTADIGIRLAGDCNANFFRDITFYEVGTREVYANQDNGDKETNAAILLEELDNGNAGVYENQFTHIFHTNSTNGILFYFKGVAKYNCITNVGTEVNGRGTILKQRGEGAQNNIIQDYINNNYYGEIVEDYFPYKNILRWGLFNNGITVKDNTTSESAKLNKDSISLLDESNNPIVTIAKDYSSFENAKVIKINAYSPQYEDLKKYKFLTINCPLSASSYFSVIVKFNLSSLAYYAANVAEITGEIIIRKGNGTITFDYSNLKTTSNGTMIYVPIIDGDNIDFYLRPAGNGNNVKTVFRGQIEIIGNINSYSIFEETEPYTGALSNNNIGIYGPTTQRPSYPQNGQCYFDTSLSPAKPIWWSGSNWVDATGTPV